MTVSVLTASLPSRNAMLAEAKASVMAQTYRNVEHLIGVDIEREGAGAVLNRLLSCASGDYVMVLDDDDLLNPNHIDWLLSGVATHDVVYSLPKVMGGSFTQYAAPFDRSQLDAGHNCVSHTALMRSAMVREVGGWNDVRHFDLDLFQRLAAHGAEFLQIPEVTWTYRLHGSNWSHGTLRDAAL
jgi:glycosyltransferase involved in cell wall biosynthesis